MTALPLRSVESEIDDTNRELEGASAEEVIRWAADRFGRGLVMSSSFGAQAAVMLHLATSVVPDIPVVWIDTGYLFPETYRFAEALRVRLRLNLVVAQSETSPARMEALHGRLWEEDDEALELYDRLRKVEPMDRALEDLDARAWLAGLRAEQTDFRRSLRRVDVQDGRFKIHPLLDWTAKDVEEYLTRHELPYHPLVAEGYRSIGDAHSTRRVLDGEDEREGRFGGRKQECGLHLPRTPGAKASLASSRL